MAIEKSGYLRQSTEMRRYLQQFRQYWVEDVSFITLLFMLGFTIFVLPSLLEIVLDELFLINAMLLVIYFTGIWSARTTTLIVLSTVFFISILFLKLYRFSVDDVGTELLLAEKIASSLNVAVYIFINFKLLFRDDRFNFHRVIGAINVYLLVALFGAILFEQIHLIFGTSIKGDVTLRGTDIDFVDYIYFSLSSLTTVGYGEITAANPAAKMLAVFLSTVGILYPAVVIARLVSIQQASSDKSSPGNVPTDREV